VTVCVCVCACVCVYNRNSITLQQAWSVDAEGIFKIKWNRDIFNYRYM
jgi:hypothetical protein